MATYEYQCSTCGKRFDYVQSMKDDAFVECPADVCEQESPGHGEVHRLISGGGGVIYRGEGFYLTDYARKGDGAAKNSGGESADGKATKEAPPASTPPAAPASPPTPSTPTKTS